MKVDFVYPTPYCEQCIVADLDIEQTEISNYFGTQTLDAEARVTCKHQTACAYVYNECFKSNQK